MLCCADGAVGRTRGRERETNRRGRERERKRERNGVREEGLREKARGMCTSIYMEEWRKEKGNMWMAVTWDIWDNGSEVR